MSEHICLDCGRVNRSGARFCASCQRPLARAAPSVPTSTGPPCPRCLAANPTGARYCIACGAALQPTSQRPKGATGSLSLNTGLHNGRYVVESLLGQGGMGAVYKVRDTRLQNKRWAAKEMSTAGLATTEELRQGVEAFRREAAMLATLSHRNLPKVIDNFEEHGREYLVMELVEGHTLTTLMTNRGGPLQVDQVVGWGEQLCDVLGYLHNQKPPIIFRDLKPDNIMVDNSGVVKLIDFGIARHFTPGKKADTMAFGTTGYAPPEQYGKGQTDARSDIYALAATMHQLLTGRDPSQNPFNFSPARQLNQRVSDALSTALQKALSTSPDARWASAADFRKALRAPASVQPQASAIPVAFQSSMPARPAPPPPAAVSWPKAAPQPAPTTTPGRRRAGIVAYMLIVGGLAVISVLLRRADLLDTLQTLVGDPTLSGLLFLTLLWMAPILAYLLTRRPMAAFLVYALGEWLGNAVPIVDLDNELLQNALITAAAIEVVFLVSGYRTRGALVGVIAALAGAITSIAILVVRYGYAPDATDLVVAILAGLLGGLLAAMLATVMGRG